MLLAIDPGTERSAWVTYNGLPRQFGIEENDELLDVLRHHDSHGRLAGVDTVVIEKIESYGMAVGAEIFETVFWTGRFSQAALVPVFRLPRREVKLQLCDSVRAKDANVRQALIDRFGPVGTKKDPGPLYGIKADIWAALGVAVTFADQSGGRA